MNKKGLKILLALLPAGACAHHSTLGFYDPDEIIDIEGIVKSVSMRNPHIHFVVEVTNASGETVDWAIETSALSGLRSRGLDRAFMTPGDRIRVAGEAARRDQPAMWAKNLLLEDGSEVVMALRAEPYFTAERTGFLEAVYSETDEREARESADGIFRVWSTVLEDPSRRLLFNGVYPLTAAAAAVQAEFDPVADSLLACWKKGMPHLMVSPLPMEFVWRGDDIVMRFEEDDAERLIHMSERIVPPETHSLLGHSTGHWDRDDLVVETVSIDSPRFDGLGTPQSTELETVERFSLNETQDRLEYRLTVTDPNTFARPVEIARYWIWRPEITVKPWDCEERE